MLSYTEQLIVLLNIRLVRKPISPKAHLIDLVLQVEAVPLVCQASKLMDVFLKNRTRPAKTTKGHNLLRKSCHTHLTTPVTMTACDHGGSSGSTIKKQSGSLHRAAILLSFYITV